MSELTTDLLMKLIDNKYEVMKLTNKLLFAKLTPYVANIIDLYDFEIGDERLTYNDSNTSVTYISPEKILVAFPTDWDLFVEATRYAYDRQLFHKPINIKYIQEIYNSVYLQLKGEIK